jgi:hypothetical protein
VRLLNARMKSPYRGARAPTRAKASEGQLGDEGSDRSRVSSPELARLKILFRVVEGREEVMSCLRE